MMIKTGHDTLPSPPVCGICRSCIDASPAATPTQFDPTKVASLGVKLHSLEESARDLVKFYQFRGELPGGTPPTASPKDGAQQEAV